LAQELFAELSAIGEDHLAAQISNLAVSSCSYDPSCEAGYIRVESDEKLNVVEKNIIGTRHGRTISVGQPRDVYLDVDNFERVIGIELLAAAAYAEKLMAYRGP
jgi:uncharacterized protein YuzE